MVDDSTDDLFFMERALLDATCLRLVGTAHDGVEAVCYLAGLGNYDNRQEHPYPDVMLLDLKMPRQSGFEVLEWLRRQEQRPKVVVLTSSPQQVDCDKALELGADLFQVKPTALQGWKDVVKSIEASLCRQQPEPAD